MQKTCEKRPKLSGKEMVYIKEQMSRGKREGINILEYNKSEGSS